ncbi:energy transducer TonB [Kiritimatiellaeota bacterium B1221]|nr:energy transducer TonB [Kiritimatiellaeota bacterium B1221]
MKGSSEIDFAQAAPRWTWRVVLLALAMTACLFVLLPMTERISRRPDPDLLVREIEQVSVPPPLKPPPPPEVPLETNPISMELPQPKLSMVADQAPPLKLPVDLQPSLSGLQGVMHNTFQVEGEGLAMGLSAGVFEISDLDKPPRPLVRVNPVYPPRARMRKIEGFVTVEFVVGVDGKVRDVQVVQAEPGAIFDAAVERALRGWRFEPGVYQGRAVDARVSQRIDFNLD